MKIVLVISLGNWTDGQFKVLVAPEGSDLSALKHEYGEKALRYYPFITFLQQKGFREPTKDEIEEIWTS